MRAVDGAVRRSASRRRPQNSGVVAFLVAVVSIAGCSTSPPAPPGAPDRALVDAGGVPIPAPHSGPPRLLNTSELSDAEKRFGISAERTANITYQPDVVLLRAGVNAIRALSDDGLVWTLDPNAEGIDDIQPGKVLLLSTRASGRVLAVTRTNAGIDVVLGPAEMTDIIREGSFSLDQPVDLTQALPMALPQLVRSRAGGRADRGEPGPWAAWLLHHPGAPCCSGSRARLQRVPDGEHPGRGGGTAVEAGRCAAGSAGPAAARAAAIELSPRHQARTDRVGAGGAEGRGRRRGVVRSRRFRPERPQRQCRSARSGRSVHSDQRARDSLRVARAAGLPRADGLRVHRHREGARLLCADRRHARGVQRRQVQPERPQGFRDQGSVVAVARRRRVRADRAGPGARRQRHDRRRRRRIRRRSVRLREQCVHDYPRFCLEQAADPGVPAGNHRDVGGCRRRLPHVHQRLWRSSTDILSVFRITAQIKDAGGIETKPAMLASTGWYWPKTQYCGG